MRVDSNSCGAVAEDSAKTARWAVFSSAARAIHPRPPRTPVSEPGTGVSVLSVLQKGKQGWIRTASTRRTVRRGKKPLCNSDDRCLRQKQGGAVGAAASRMRVPPKARCSRWEPRPGLLIQRGSRRPPAPTKKPQRIQVQGILVRLAFDFPSAFEILTVGLFSCISICCSCFIRFIFARLTLKQKTRVVKPFG